MLVSWNYRFRNSPMDHIDPRARFIFSFALLFAATATWNPIILFVLFLIAITWYLMARLTWKDTKVGWFMISIMLFTMIARQHHHHRRWGWWRGASGRSAGLAGWI